MKVLLASLILSMSTVAMAGEGAKESIEWAKKAQKEAAAVGFAWRDWGKMMKKAEEAMKKGDEKKAMKIANQIVAQSKTALKQAETAKKAGPRF